MCTLTGLPGIAFGAVSFFLNRLKIPIFVSPTSFLKGIIVKFGILYYNIDMSERRNLPIGIQTFEELRTKNCVYRYPLCRELFERKGAV